MGCFTWVYALIRACVVDKAEQARKKAKQARKAADRKEACTEADDRRLRRCSLA